MLVWFKSNSAAATVLCWIVLLLQHTKRLTRGVRYQSASVIPFGNDGSFSMNSCSVTICDSPIYLSGAHSTIRSSSLLQMQAFLYGHKSHRPPESKIKYKICLTQMYMWKFTVMRNVGLNIRIMEHEKLRNQLRCRFCQIVIVKYCVAAASVKKNTHQ